MSRTLTATALPPASHLKSHLGFWMRVVSNAVSHAFARRLESSGVTVAEWVVLREMYGAEPTTPPSHIASVTGLTRGAVSKLIERLLAKGLVTRNEAVGDRRYQQVALTRSGSALVPRLGQLADENDAQFFGVLSAAERRALLQILKTMATRHGLKRLPIE